MKTLICITTLSAFLLIGCKKPSNNNNSTGSGSAITIVKDSDNYVIIEGKTYYHYHYSTSPAPTALFASGLYTWMNLSVQPFTTYPIMTEHSNVSYSATSKTLMLSNIGTGSNLQTYLRAGIDLKPTTVNGYSAIEFSDIKVSKVGTMDSVMVTGKIICNGK